MVRLKMFPNLTKLKELKHEWDVHVVPFMGQTDKQDTNAVTPNVVFLFVMLVQVKLAKIVSLFAMQMRQ